jgi:ribokinase
MTGRVLVLGALHHDVVVTADRLPRLDETLMGRDVDYRFGGKGGNQALAAARMGAEVAMAGRLGDDAAGRTLRATLEAAEVDHGGVVTLPGRATGMSVAITDAQGGYGAVIVSAANLENDGAWAGPAPDVALIQNEIPGVANRALTAALPETARLIWNAAPARAWDATLAARCDLLVVNRVEAADACGTDAAEDAAALLRTRVRGAVIVTLGAEGLILADRAGPPVRHTAIAARKVVSTHGAGDMFCGALAAELAAGAALPRAVTVARTAARLFVQTPIADRADLTRARVAEALASRGSEGG